MTITTPEGVKVRSESKRRFHIVRVRIQNGAATDASIEKRSDSIDTARTHVSRKGRFDGTRADHIVRHIFDSKTEEFVR